MIKMAKRNNRDENSYDAIVIGSGMGGLTTASLLANVGAKRVLLLESHFKFGGFLHSFRRKKFVWDPGVHYVGEMQEGGMARKCMDLVTGGNVDWRKIESDYERFIFPEATFDVPSGKKEYQERLIQRFPDEEKNIRRYFKDVTAVQNWSHRWFMSKQFSKPLASLLSLGKRLALKNTLEYVEGRFDNPLLRAIVCAQWPDYGTPPAESALGIHGAVQADFFNGGFYPIGGSQVIADTAIEVIKAYGGTCLVNHPVQEILVDNNQAYGVLAQHKGEVVEFQAPLIISNAGARSTFTRMLPGGVGERERKQLFGVRNGTSAVVLYLGLNDDPRKHGFEECNYWLYNRLDFGTSAPVADEVPAIGGAFLSFGSMRDPDNENHTAQIVSFSRESEWNDHSSRPWRKRGDDYENRKDEYAEQMIDFVAKRLPELRNLIEYQELSTPLTVKSFTGHPGGAIYGQECDVNRLSRDQWSIGTSVKGLYLTGSDVGLPGVNGALMAGVMTAGKLMGWLGMPKIFARAYSNPSTGAK